MGSKQNDIKEIIEELDVQDQYLSFLENMVKFTAAFGGPLAVKKLVKELKRLKEERKKEDQEAVKSGQADFEYDEYMDNQVGKII